MIIDCISDTHSHYPHLEGGDLLIVAGDLTARDTFNEFIQFDKWIRSQQYEKAIYIAGNHDNYLFSLRRTDDKFGCHPNGKVEYLCDSGTEFTFEYDDIEMEICGMHPTVERTFKIWGSPWTKTFEGINPACKAFTLDTEEELAEKWALIPNDVDILITHSPPHGILDQVCYIDYGKDQAEHVGSTSLKEYVLNKVKPKLWIWGHIHEAYGQGQIVLDYPNTIICVNSSHVNERYKPVNKPIRIIL